MSFYRSFFDVKILACKKEIKNDIKKYLRFTFYADIFCGKFLEHSFLPRPNRRVMNAKSVKFTSRKTHGGMKSQRNSQMKQD